MTTPQAAEAAERRPKAPRRAGLEARAFAGLHEWEAYTRLALAAFRSDVEGEEAAAVGRAWLARLVRGPEFATALGRGAFVEGDLAGGYVMWLRNMQIGAVLARTACIGGVVVDGARRGRGIGRTLMLDAVAEATRRHAAVILLDGIANFYRPFGFVDVWDPERHVVARGDVRALTAPSALRVRPAAPGDASALATLYRRHFRDRYTGTFEHSRALAAHRAQWAGANGASVHVAVDRMERVRGYLLLPRRPVDTVREVAADSREAAAALVRAHAAMAEASGDGGAELGWEAPSDGLTFALLADLLPVRSEVRRLEGAGWLARPGDGRALARVARGAAGSVGQRAALALAIDGVDCSAEAAEPTRAALAPRVSLTGAVWLALAFRHRPLAWAAAQPGQLLPRAAEAALESWLPKRPTWVPGSDRF